MGESGQSAFAANFPGAGESEIALDFELRENFLDAGEHVAQTRQIARGGFRQGHAAGAAARAVADAPGFQHDNRFVRRRADAARRLRPGR